MSDYLERTKQGTVFTGSDVRIFQALAIASALDFYDKVRIPINRAYTPKAMLRAVATITGRGFRRGQYAEAAEALRSWANTRKTKPRE